MLEQWEADRLLRMPKIYSHTATVDLAAGVDEDYQLESDDGTEFFLLDVRRSPRNPRGGRFQLRYQRDIVLSRLCFAVTHGNPDGEVIGFPHFHRYREGFGDRYATELEAFDDIESMLRFFCKQLHIAEPVIQGGLS
jgi:hypothetical protein